MMLLLFVVGMSAVGWCIEKRWQHNRQPVIHTILGNQDAKDDTIFKQKDNKKTKNQCH